MIVRAGNALCLTFGQKIASILITDDGRAEFNDFSVVLRGNDFPVLIGEPFSIRLVVLPNGSPVFSLMGPSETR